MDASPQWVVGDLEEGYDTQGAYTGDGGRDPGEDPLPLPIFGIQKGRCSSFALGPPCPVGRCRVPATQTDSAIGSLCRLIRPALFDSPSATKRINLRINWAYWRSPSARRRSELVCSGEEARKALKSAGNHAVSCSAANPSRSP